MLDALKKRFEQNPHRHPGVSFDAIVEKLSTPKVQKALKWMEETQGEPDVLIYEKALYLVDFSKESPKGRMSVCYDEEARLGRKKFPPAASAVGLASQNGLVLVDETLYQYMQSIEDLDEKTSSWLYTPASLRALGGALFGDKRYKRTFIYHNGADSYYGVRSFRTYLKLD